MSYKRQGYILSFFITDFYILKLCGKRYITVFAVKLIKKFMGMFIRFESKKTVYKTITVYLMYLNSVGLFDYQIFS